MWKVFAPNESWQLLNFSFNTKYYFERISFIFSFLLLKSWTDLVKYDFHQHHVETRSLELHFIGIIFHTKWYINGNKENKDFDIMIRYEGNFYYFKIYLVLRIEIIFCMHFKQLLIFLHIAECAVLRRWFISTHNINYTCFNSLHHTSPIK